MKVTKAKLIIFSIAVALVSVFFFAYAIQSVYPAPELQDFCEISDRVIVGNETLCLEQGGQWTDYGKDMLAEPSGWCDVDFTCREEYNAVKEVYERNVFFANIIIGILLFVFAIFLKVNAISSGLMSGAVILIVYGTIRYWGELSDIWRTIILGIALTVLIWLGYKKLND